MGKKILNNDRVGQIRKNTFGSLMEVVEYNHYRDVLVKFETGNTKQVKWGEFVRGKVKNPYDKTVFGIGYFGEGEYKSHKDGKYATQYKTWYNMMRRCYDKKNLKNHPTYKDCSVVEEWHNFQTFGNWFDENYYEIECQRMELDKDILIKGNKIYSPNTCVFVPHNINSMIVKGYKSTKIIGVSFIKNENRYTTQCHDNEGNSEYLGSYKNPIEAFRTYKNFKEKVIKNVADKYKGKIPNKLYEALLQYEVEITD